MFIEMHLFDDFQSSTCSVVSVVNRQTKWDAAGPLTRWQTFENVFGVETILG